MSNDIARLGYEIDSSQAKTAAGALDKMNAAAMKAERGAKSLKAASRDLMRDEGGRFMSAAQAAGKYGDEIDQLRTKYNPLYAASKQFEAQQTELQRALALGAISIGQYDTALAGLQAGMLRSGQSAAVFGKGMQASAQHTTNLMFQFQDIGMMLAAGQNPLMLAMQQGTQVSGIFHQMEMNGQSAFGGIKAGLLAMVSPMSLMTIGVIAGGAALVQWGISALGADTDAKTLTETIDDLESSVSAVNEISKIYSADGLQSLVDKYGEVNGEILAMIENQKTFAVGAAMQSARDAVAALVEELGNVPDSADMAMRFGGIAAQNMAREMGLTTAQVVALGDALEAASQATTLDAQSAALAKINAILAQSKVAFSELTGDAIKAESAMRELANSAPSANWMSAAISGVFSLGDAIRARITEARTLAAAFTPGTYTEGGMDAAKGRVQPGGGVAIATRPEDIAGGSDGGGGGAADPYAANLERLITSLQTERDTVDEWYQESIAVLNDRRAMELLGAKEHADALLMIEEELQRRKAAVRDDDLSHYESFFGSMAGALQSGGSKMLAISKGFALAEAAVSIWRGAAKALELPFPASLAAWGQVIATGAKALSGIKSASFGGGGGGGGASGPTNATSARAEPEKTTRIELMGEDWLVSLAETMMDQIYTASGKGRVIISKANA